MKMEVVLSASGRFGNDETPFKNEEIREWSGVDQITGMLEQARIETGQWRAFNNGSAHSYGKMVDSRQRNNVDGTVVQKARRQVEVFQSQEPGKRVQVVRAFQWSSSRVTDNLEPPSLLDNSDKHSFLKRSTSDDDLSLFPLENPPKSPVSSFTRASKLRRSLQIPSHHQKISLPASTSQKSPLSLNKLENPKKSLENRGPQSSGKLGESHYSSIKPQKALETHFIGDSPVESHYIPISSTITLKTPKKSEISIKTSSPKAHRPPHLSQKSPEVKMSSPKPQRSQVTVVNLINPPKTSIVTLGSREILGIPAVPGLSKKKVGFCKTEVHFAADSGKVNIVETDGKPPPTNKFRRRRKNPTLSPNLLKSKDADLGMFGENEKKVWINSEVNPKIHTTTICLGDAAVGGAVDKLDFRSGADLESPKAVSEVISRGNLGNFVSRDAEDNKVLSTVVTTHETTIARVKDTISSGKTLVTSEKKPLDGGEDKRMETEKTGKSEEPQQKSRDKGARAVETDRITPLYVNVFGRVRDAFPVYENYRVGDDKKPKSEMKQQKSEIRQQKDDKERLLTKNKAKTVNNVVKKTSLEKRGSLVSSSTGGRTQRDVVKLKTSKRPVSGDGTRAKKQPMEVVYRTAVYNMRNEKLAKPSPPKSKSGPRLLNDLICGGKPKKSTNSTKRKTPTSSQGVKGSSQPVRHWK